jgi:hypothetical protein
MKGRGFAVGVLAALGVFAWTGRGRADDTIRLNLVDNAPTKTLVDDGKGADTVRTWYRGGFGWGGYRGFGFGGYRGFGWGGYRGFGFGGYRGFGYGGFYRPYYGFGYGGFYRPYYGFGYGRLGYGLGYGLGGYGLGGYGLGGYGLGYGLGGFGLGGYGYGIGYGGYWGPCSGGGVVTSTYTLNMPVATLGTPLPQAVPQAPVIVPNDGATYPYDGGPQQVVPTPQAVPNPPEVSTPPAKAPRRTVPLEGRSVSLPKASGKWTYPAYGETAKRMTPESARTYYTKSEAKKTNSQ